MPEPYTIQCFRDRLALVYKDNAGTRHRYQLNTTDEREASLLAPSLYAELIRPKGRTCGELWEAYKHAKAGKASMETRPYAWKALEERFSAKPGDSITDEDCNAHIAERRSAGIKDGTLYTELTLLRTILKWSEKKGFIAKAPEILRPSQPVRKEGHLTKDQCLKLIDAAGHPHIKLFITLALGTGARNAAILGLTWARCDFRRELIDLRDPALSHVHKGRAIVPMTNRVLGALLDAYCHSTIEHVIEWHSKRVLSVKRSIKTTAKSAGLEKFTPAVSPHLFRHSAAVHMAEDGVEMEVIAQFLEHKDVNVTRRIYARFSPDYLRRAARALDY